LKSLTYALGLPKPRLDFLCLMGMGHKEEVG
jgi:hypothetical protein